MKHANPERSGQLAANVAIALRFKKSQGTPAMPQVEKEVLAANYDRARGGNFHLASNARDQGWAHPGMYLRDAFPDRVDVMEQVIADGDRVVPGAELLHLGARLRARHPLGRARARGDAAVERQRQLERDVGHARGHELGPRRDERARLLAEDATDTLDDRSQRDDGGHADGNADEEEQQPLPRCAHFARRHEQDESHTGRPSRSSRRSTESWVRHRAWLFVPVAMSRISTWMKAPPLPGRSMEWRMTCHCLPS